LPMQRPKQKAELCNIVGYAMRLNRHD